MGQDVHFSVRDENQERFDEVIDYFKKQNISYDGLSGRVSVNSCLNMIVAVFHKLFVEGAKQVSFNSRKLMLTKATYKDPGDEAIKKQLRLLDQQNQMLLYMTFFIGQHTAMVATVPDSNKEFFENLPSIQDPTSSYNEIFRLLADRLKADINRADARKVGRTKAAKKRDNQESQYEKD